MSSAKAAALGAVTAPPAQPAFDDSLAVFARDLAPTAQPDSVVIPVNTSRQVRELPWPMRAIRLVRRLFGRGVGAMRLASFRKLDRRTRLIVGAVGGALVLTLVIAIIVWTAGKPAADARNSPIATRARPLLEAGEAKQAADMIE